MTYGTDWGPSPLTGEELHKICQKIRMRISPGGARYHKDREAFEKLADMINKRVNNGIE